MQGKNIDGVALGDNRVSNGLRDNLKSANRTKVKADDRNLHIRKIPLSIQETNHEGIKLIRISLGEGRQGQIFGLHEVGKTSDPINF